MMVFLYLDMEKELGPVLDWVCSRAAEEQKPVGTYIAQVVKQYRDDILAQELRERTDAIYRRKFERVRAQTVAPDPPAPVVEKPLHVPDGGRSNNR